MDMGEPPPAGIRLYLSEC